MRGLGSIDSVSSVLEGLARRLGLESKLLESRLRRNWVSIVGEPIASNTWPDQIRYKKLYLLVHNSVWLHQLTFLKPTLIHKLNTVAGGELITDIVLRVGELPATNNVPASPRGPSRDRSPPRLRCSRKFGPCDSPSKIRFSAIASQLMAQVLAQPRAPKAVSGPLKSCAWHTLRRRRLLAIQHRTNSPFFFLILSADSTPARLSEILPNISVFPGQVFMQHHRLRPPSSSEKI